MYSKNLGRFAQLFAWIILSSICYFQSRQASSHAINKKMFGFFCLDSFSTIFQLWLSIYTVPGVMWVATQKMVPIGLDLQKWDFWYIKSWKINSRKDHFSVALGPFNWKYSSRTRPLCSCAQPQLPAYSATEDLIFSGFWSFS